MPFGKFKGTPIDEMKDKKDYMKEFMKMKGFTQNKNIRQVFRKTQFGDLMKDEKDYKDLIQPSRTKSKFRSRRKSKKGSLRRKHKKTRNKHKSLLYFNNKKI